jgi:hypothetical protein
MVSGELKEGGIGCPVGLEVLPLFPSCVKKRNFGRGYFIRFVAGTW